MTADIINTTWGDNENKTNRDNLFQEFILSAIWRDIINTIWVDNSFGQPFRGVNFDGIFFYLSVTIYIFICLYGLLFWIRIICWYLSSLTIIHRIGHHHIFENTVPCTRNEVCVIVKNRLNWTDYLSSINSLEHMQIYWKDYVP